MPSLSTPPLEGPAVAQGGQFTQEWVHWVSDLWRTVVPRRQVYIPTSAGVPTFTPEDRGDFVAMCYDTVNEDLYVYNGGWVKVTLA